tara:strand:- start:3 stop:464 length:462 start_codon:yes stop_codon:yes gene_type:complete
VKRDFGNLRNLRTDSAKSAAGGSASENKDALGTIVLATNLFEVCLYGEENCLLSKVNMARQKSLLSLNLYIYRVLKQVHHDIGISRNGMCIINDYILDVILRVVRQAFELAELNKKSTITSREIQTAVRLTLPGELAKHAVSEGLINTLYSSI